MSANYFLNKNDDFQTGACPKPQIASKRYSHQIFKFELCPGQGISEESFVGLIPKEFPLKNPDQKPFEDVDFGESDDEISRVPSFDYSKLTLLTK